MRYILANYAILFIFVVSFKVVDGFYQFRGDIIYTVSTKELKINSIKNKNKYIGLINNKLLGVELLVNLTNNNLIITKSLYDTEKYNLMDIKNLDSLKNEKILNKITISNYNNIEPSYIMMNNKIMCNNDWIMNNTDNSLIIFGNSTNNNEIKPFYYKLYDNDTLNILWK